MNDLIWYDALMARCSSTAGRLISAVPIEPLPLQLSILDECIRTAKRMGLRLPSRLKVRWRVGSRSHEFVHGATSRNFKTGETNLYLDALLWAEELPRVIYHELAHASDYETGMYRSLSVGAMEHRADTFSVAMLNGEPIPPSLLPRSPSTTGERAAALPDTSYTAQHLLDELRHRVHRLRRRLPEADRWELRAILQQIEALALERRA